MSLDRARSRSVFSFFRPASSSFCSLLHRCCRQWPSGLQRATSTRLSDQDDERSNRVADRVKMSLVYRLFVALLFEFARSTNGAAHETRLCSRFFRSPHSFFSRTSGFEHSAGDKKRAGRLGHRLVLSCKWRPAAEHHVAERRPSDRRLEVCAQTSIKSFIKVAGRYKIKTLADGLSILRIEPTTLADNNRTLSCTAENGIGSPVKAEAKLHVLSNG